MQLILETENTSIGLKETMSTLEKDIEAVKNITNDINTIVPNGDKENIEYESAVEETNDVLNEEKLITNDTETPLPIIKDKDSLENDEPAKLDESNNIGDLTEKINPETEDTSEKGQATSNGRNEFEEVDFKKDMKNVECSETLEGKEIQPASNCCDNSENCNLQTDIQNIVLDSKPLYSESLSSMKDNVVSSKDVCDDEQPESLKSRSPEIEQNSSQIEVKCLPENEKEFCADKPNDIATIREDNKVTQVQEVAVTEEDSVKDISMQGDNAVNSIKNVELETEPVNSEEIAESIGKIEQSLDKTLNDSVDEIETPQIDPVEEIETPEIEPISFEKNSNEEPMECEDMATSDVTINKNELTNMLEKLNENITEITEENSNKRETSVSIENSGDSETNETTSIAIDKTDNVVNTKVEESDSELVKDSSDIIELMEVSDSKADEIITTEKQNQPLKSDHKTDNFDTTKAEEPSSYLIKDSSDIVEPMDVSDSKADEINTTEEQKQPLKSDHKTDNFDTTKKEEPSSDLIKDSSELMDVSDSKTDDINTTQEQIQPSKSDDLQKNEPTTESFKDAITNNKTLDNKYPLLKENIEVTEENKNEKIDESVFEKTNGDVLDKTNGDDVFVVEDEKDEKDTTNSTSDSTSKFKATVPLKMKLSNTLNILSDDEDEPATFENKSSYDHQGLRQEIQASEKIETTSETKISKEIVNDDKNCINLDDDDDIMLIDEDSTPNENVIEKKDDEALTNSSDAKAENDVEKVEEQNKEDTKEVNAAENEPDLKVPEVSSNAVEVTMGSPATTETKETPVATETKKTEKRSPLLPENLFKNYRKNLADMTRDELEEFCILKIVESIIDRSDLNDIRTKLKTMAQNIDEYKKKTMMLLKQNRDLKLVLTSVQEELKKGGDNQITPLKITRSVGMQVLMTDKVARKKGLQSLAGPGPAGPSPNNRIVKNANQKQQVQNNNNPPIPVPRLVPAPPSTVVNRSPTVIQSPVKTQQPKPSSSPMPNGVKMTSPVGKPEKRPHNKMLTVDLTDDEPPSKVPANAKLPSSPPVRLVPPQNLMAPRQQLAQNVNSPRKVYIPIGGPQSANVRPGQAIMLKAVPPPGPRARGPVTPMVRIPQNSVRMGRAHNGRHPAPLPDVVKQYQSPNWKALPPAPDLKLSKVENGIVISWKIEGYQEDSYEEIASYQLYAYQETSAPPNTSLWKKIGDVKALPLPMACTLTQFMAGYKYYFAVRAVDVKSRLGPFSLPGSILLLNKM